MRCTRRLALAVGIVFAFAGSHDVWAQDSTDVWEAVLHQQLYTPYAGKLPPLNARVWSTFSPVHGVLADRVTYATADGMRVPAVVYRPDPRVTRWKGRLPGIVIVLLYFVVTPVVLWKMFFKKYVEQAGLVRYATLAVLILFMASLPIKMMLRWTLNLKYLVAIPEYFFNI